MSKTVFLVALECRTRQRGVTFDVGELIEFVDEVWPVARHAVNDVERWIEQFQAATELAGSAK